MKFSFRAFFLHVTLFLDCVGNWLFNIYLFNQLKTIENKAVFIALLFSVIRFSNFASLFLGGKFFNRPKKSFVISVVLRVFVLSFVFLYVEKQSALSAVYILLIALLVKNILGGMDGGVYSQIINRYFINRTFHYKLRDFIVSFSLIFSFPLYCLVSGINERLPLMFDIISYMILLILVIISKFELQKMQNKFVLKVKDLFQSMYSTKKSSMLLITLFSITLFNTTIFNYSYQYFLESNLFDGVQVLYFIIGLTFFLGNTLSKFIEYKFNLVNSIVIYFLSITTLVCWGGEAYVNISVFVFSNTFHAFNLFKINVAYYPNVPVSNTNVMSNLYSIIFLASSIIGAWLLSVIGVKYFYVIGIFNLILIFLLIFLKKLFFYIEERNVLIELNQSIRYFTFKDFTDTTYLHIYNNNLVANSSHIGKSNLEFIRTIFESHNKVYSEVIERILSSDLLKERKYRPLSNGCACHVDEKLCYLAAYNEVLERDSIILHFMFQIPPIYSISAGKLGYKLDAKFYFFTTNDPKVVACLLYGNDIIAYSTLSGDNFSLGVLKNGTDKSYSEYLATYSSHLKCKILAPEYSNEFEGHNNYYNNYIDKHAGSSLLLNILFKDKSLFDFLDRNNRIIDIKNYTNEIWKALHPFENVAIEIETKYYSDYARYFSCPVDFNFAYPIWPSFDSAYCQNIENRLKKNFSQYELQCERPCPII
jgi:MFS family permease